MTDRHEMWGNLGMDLEACAEMANKLADELEQRVADVVSVFPASPKRILLTGTPLAIPNWKLHHIFETWGPRWCARRCARAHATSST